LKGVRKGLPCRTSAAAFYLIENTQTFGTARRNHFWTAV
jgi:hypothetical protein